MQTNQLANTEGVVLTRPNSKSNKGNGPLLWGSYCYWLYDRKLTAAVQNSTSHKVIKKIKTKRVESRCFYLVPGKDYYIIILYQIILAELIIG